MKTATRTISATVGGLVLGVVMLAMTAPAAGQDWPQWRGPNRDGKAPASAPEAWPKELTKKWKVTVGSDDSTPAVVGDKVYVFARQGGDEVTLCLNLADGTEVWRDKYPAVEVTGAAKQHAGPRSSPAVADGKVVTLGVGGVLSCLDANDKGKVLWRNEEFKSTPKFFTASSPLIADGLAIAQLGGPGKGVLIALDLATGAKKWALEGDGPGYSSPVLLTADGVKQVVAMTEKQIVGVALADGKLLWQIPFATTGMSYNAATPIVDGQTLIYTGQGRGTAAVKIEKKGDAFAATPLWTNPDKLGTKFNTPVLKDGLLFGLSDKGLLFCIDTQAGKTAWTDTVNRDTYAGMVDAGSALLVLPNNSTLLVIKPSDKLYTEVAKFKVADTATYASPVLLGKKLLVKDQDSLTLWGIE